MRKFTIYNLQFTIIAFIFTFYILHFTFAQTVTAAESSPSANIRIKLEELKKDIASKAAKLKNEVSRKLINKAYVGTVENKQNFSANKTATEITLVTKTGAKIVTINQDTVSPKTLNLKDYVAALGDIDDTGVLTAKKIILLPTTNYQLKTYFWGQIISISGKLITLKDKDAKNVAVSLNSQSQFKLNDFVILTGIKNRNDIFEAGFIFVIP